MSVRVAINGFGRIGRNTFKAGFGRLADLEFVAVNDLTDNKTNAHLLKWDSTFGQYKGTVEAVEDGILVDGKKVTVLAEKVPSKISWKDYGVDIVIESTGFFTDGAAAAAERRPLGFCIQLTSGVKVIVKNIDTGMGND